MRHMALRRYHRYLTNLANQQKFESSLLGVKIGAELVA